MEKAAGALFARQPRIAQLGKAIECARGNASAARFRDGGAGLVKLHLQTALCQTPRAAGAGRSSADHRDTMAAPVRHPVMLFEMKMSCHYSGATMALFFAKSLEIAGMLTLGVALFVYGFGESDMNAELAWLMIGSVIFLAGYALEKRSGGRA